MIATRNVIPVKNLPPWLATRWRNRKINVKTDKNNSTWKKFYCICAIVGDVVLYSKSSSKSNFSTSSRVSRSFCFVDFCCWSVVKILVDESVVLVVVRSWLQECSWWKRKDVLENLLLLLIGFIVKVSGLESSFMTNLFLASHWKNSKVRLILVLHVCREVFCNYTFELQDLGSQFLFFILNEYSQGKRDRRSYSKL